MKDIVTIRAAIQQMYEEIDVDPPTPASPVAPLSLLLERLDVQSDEINDLSTRAVAGYFQEWGKDASELKSDGTPLAGYMLHWGGVTFVFAEKGDLVVRRRFSIGHEIGHVRLHLPAILHDDANSTVAIVEFAGANEDAHDLGTDGIAERRSSSGVYLRLPDLETMEREANWFSAELLMPADVVRELHETEFKSLHEADRVRRMAGEFLVSNQSMQYRLEKLGLLRGA